MEDEQLLRYSRQIQLPGIDVAGQERLLAARVLIVGLGGLGSPVAMYLASSGVGHLVLSDPDRVDLSNLQRQIVHTTRRVGELKVFSAKTTLEELNPEVRVTAIDRKLDAAELTDEVARADVVVDATDNFTSRFVLNEACVRLATPLVSGAAIRMEGQVSVFRSDLAHSPCYACLYPNMGELEERCSQTGVLGSVVGVIGSIQATEAVKVLLNLGDAIIGRLLVLDARTMEWRCLRLRRDPDCPVCGLARRDAAVGT